MVSADAPVVGIVMGSKSDYAQMAAAVEILNQLEVAHEARVLSAHRNPEETARYADQAAGRGLKVLIAGAGGAAHLAGALAARTLLPVIGVPIESAPLGGLDALLSTVQMPRGVPVATVAIGKAGAANAALLAASVLALGNAGLAERLERRRRVQAEEALAQKVP